MTVHRGETGTIPGIAPTPRHPKKREEMMIRREFLLILGFALGGIATGLAIEESPIGPRVITNALGLSGKPITGEVYAAIATSTPLPPTATPSPQPTSIDTAIPIPSSSTPPPIDTKTSVPPSPTDTETPKPTATPPNTATATATATVPAKPTLTIHEKSVAAADKITVNFPGEKAAVVRTALVQAFDIYATPINIDELNAFMGTRNGEDFRTHFNNEYKNKYSNIDFDALIKQYLAQMTPDQYPTGYLKSIRGPDDSFPDPCDDYTCLRPLDFHLFQIEIANRDFDSILPATIGKELLGGIMLDDLWYVKHVRGKNNQGKAEAGVMAEELSIAVKVFLMSKWHIAIYAIQSQIDAAWTGGIVSQ